MNACGTSLAKRRNSDYRRPLTAVFKSIFPLPLEPQQ